MANRSKPHQIDTNNLGRDKHTSNRNDIFETPGQVATVDAKIVQKEDAELKEFHELSISHPTLGDPEMPHRPNFATNGVPVVLRANLFKLHLDNSKQLFLYQADADPRLLCSKRQLRHFFQTILKRLPELQPLGHGVATDYASRLVTSAKLHLGPTDKKTYSIPYYDQEGPGSRVEAKGRNFELTLSLLQPISFADFARYLDSSNATDDKSGNANGDIIRALNIIVAGHPNKDPGVYQGSPGTFFRYPQSRLEASNYELRGGLIAVRGYFYSVRLGTARVLLNVHGQCNPFYKAVNVRELMKDFEDLVGGEYYFPKGFLCNLRVKTSYMKDPNGKPIQKFKTVVGVSPKNADETKFQWTSHPSKATVSVAQYFNAEYGVKLEYPKKRVLNCGSAAHPVWIPAELCTAMPGQRYLGELHESQTTGIRMIAARPPAENARRIVAEDGALGLIGVVPETCQTLAAFGITIDSAMVVIPGRILNSPQLKCGNGTIPTVKGVWNMNGKKFLESALMPSWTLLRIGSASHINPQTLKVQLTAMTGVFAKHGLEFVAAKHLAEPNVDLPQGVDRVPNERRPMVDESLAKIFKDYKEKGIGMFEVILPFTDSWLYSRVKYWGDVRYGIHTNCVQMSKLQKSNVSYLANLAFKANLKLGGKNWSLSSGNLGFLEDGRTMVVGIDVTHPKPGSVKGTPSIAGVVASIGADFTQWPGNIRCQESRKEMVSGLDILMEERLNLWVSVNNRHNLENIVVYRDGVSDGQYETVLREEVLAIRKACAKILAGLPQPKITVLVAVKRHHTRLYPTNDKGADPSHQKNIKNGTVVDRGITMPRKWDFFMAAHVALKGTAKPAHYVVILDEIKDSEMLGADHLERMTHNLCYLHGTCTRAISICPPAYYADIICERGRCYIEDYLDKQKSAGREFDYNETPWSHGVHDDIKNSMFYV